jgi:phage virion morphogenesis protein
MVGVSVELSQRDLERALGNLRTLETFSFRDMFEDMGEEVLNQVRARFRAQVDPEGKAWERSSRAAARGGKTLIDTSRLLRSITYDADQDRLLVGTNIAYAAAHQAPLKNAAGKLKRPRRAFMGINDADMSELQEIAMQHLGLAN